MTSGGGADPRMLGARRMPTARPRRPLSAAIAPLVLAVVLLPADAFAQRELHWDRLDVDARLEADGRLVPLGGDAAPERAAPERPY